MKQQLFIIKNGQRVELDTQGSGISMQFCNPLLAGLNKVKFSHSYTFSLPLTGNNVRAFDLFGELGHASAAYGVEYDAEYWLAGIPAIVGARLYIMESSGAAYQCTLISENARAISAIKDSGMTIRDLADGTEWEEWTPAKYGTLSKWFDSTQRVCYPRYNAGVQALNADGTIKHGTIEETDRLLAPPPCVPVAYLLRRLAEKGVDWSRYFVEYTGELSGDYDIDRDGREDMMTFGVIPCVNTAVSEERGAERWRSVYDTPETRSPLLYQSVGGGGGSPRDHSNDERERRVRAWYIEFANHEYINVQGYQVAEGGHVLLSVKGLVFTKRQAQNIDGINIIITDGKGGQGSALPRWTYFDELTPSEITDDYVIYDQTRNLGNFLEKLNSAGIPEDRALLGLAVFVKNEYEPTMSPNTQIRESVYYDEGYCTHELYLPDCLPAVPVWDFLRMVLTMYRAVPDAKQNQILRYVELKRNDQNGRITDWSGKVTRGDGWQRYDNYALQVDGLARENYYLMANESTDKDEGDGYAVTKAHYDSDNPWVQQTAEQFKAAFYPAFLQDSDFPYENTGKTIAYWKHTEEAGVYAIGEPKAAMARVVIDYAQVGDTQVPYTGIRIADIPRDLWDDTLGTWLKRPEVIKAKMRLSLMDLQQAQRWEQPVYIEELRGVFAIVKIDWREGQPANVELLRLR